MQAMEIKKLSPEEFAALSNPRANTVTAKIRALEVRDMLVFLEHEKSQATGARVLAWRHAADTGKKFSFRKREWGGFVLIRVS